MNCAQALGISSRFVFVFQRLSEGISDPDYSLMCLSLDHLSHIYCQVKEDKWMDSLDRLVGSVDEDLSQCVGVPSHQCRCLLTIHGHLHPATRISRHQHHCEVSTYITRTCTNTVTTQRQGMYLPQIFVNLLQYFKMQNFFEVENSQVNNQTYRLGLYIYNLKHNIFTKKTFHAISLPIIKHFGSILEAVKFLHPLMLLIYLLFFILSEVSESRFWYP